MCLGSESPASKFDSALGAQKYLVSRRLLAMDRVRSDAFWNDRPVRTRARWRCCPIAPGSPRGAGIQERAVLEERDGLSGFTNLRNSKSTSPRRRASEP